jgi:predicted RNA-binding protein (TIGR00451 family)
MKCREPTRDERTTLSRAFDRWGVFDLLKEKAILISDGDPRQVHLLSAAAEHAALSFDALHAGLVIGTLRKSFMPTLAGADLFARDAANEYYVTVGENAEQLVLYGRDVMGDSIASVSEGLDENELVIILNTRREAIAVGRTRFAGKAILQKGRITITTLADAGQYLRDEG